MTRTRTFSLVGAALLLCAGSAFAQSNPANMTLTRSVAGTVAAGETVSVTVTLTAAPPEEVLALGVYETIPAGTSYVAVTSSNGPSVKPVSAGATGTLGFAWIDVPAFPYSFTYTILVGSSFVSPSNITGYAEYRLSGSPLFSETTSTAVQATPVDPGDDEPEWKQGLLAGCAAGDASGPAGWTDAIVIALVALALFAATAIQPRMLAEKLRRR